jgi:hypothetical protein
VTPRHTAPKSPVSCRRRSWPAVVAVVGQLHCACGGPAPPAAASAVVGAKATPIGFVFETTEGESFDSRTTRGRGTALLFVTTYDLASQVEAKRLDRVVRRHSPPVNAAGIVLETQRYAVLADAFRTSLSLSFPVCLADAGTLRGKGPFGRLTRVPTIVVLDRSGVEIWRKEGQASSREMGQALTRASQRGSPVAE